MTTLQDAQIFKERHEDSPGILVLCQGDWRLTPERVRLFEEQNYYVLTAANGYRDIVDWLPHPRCIGGVFAHPETVANARRQHPDKVIERLEGVGGRFLRTLSQEVPYGLHNAGLPFTGTVPAALKTVDVVSVFSPVALKRGQLLIESLLAAGVSAYLFAQSLGSNPSLLEGFFDAVRKAGKSVEYFHYPFDPYALIRIDGRIVIDGRPIGANNSLVSAYLARARLVVHTSTTEGISNSVMEALLSDVPVLLCEDIAGPLQTLSQQLPECISRSEPTARALAEQIRTLVASPRESGVVREAFRRVIDPFETNRRMVTGTQEWFARHRLPWKGHCLGLLGGVQSKIDLSFVTAQQSYRGGRHIYPNAAEAVQCTSFQRKIADTIGRADHARSLQHEIAWIQSELVVSAAAPARTPDAKLHTALAGLAHSPTLRHVLVVGASTGHFVDALMPELARNPQRPQVHCMDSAAGSLDVFVSRYASTGQFHTHHCSSVARDEFPSEEEVARFHASTTGPLRAYPLQSVLGWLRRDLADMDSGRLTPNGIQEVLKQTGADRFDMAVINGREFTGSAELRHLLGCEVIVLGCTQTFKNHQSLMTLTEHPAYRLVYASPDLDNGLAIFVRTEGADAWLESAKT